MFGFLKRSKFGKIFYIPPKSIIPCIVIGECDDTFWIGLGLDGHIGYIAKNNKQVVWEDNKAVASKWEIIFNRKFNFLAKDDAVASVQRRAYIVSNRPFTHIGKDKYQTNK